MAEETLIQGIPFLGDIFLYQDEEEGVEMGTLARNQIIGGVEYAGGGPIAFYRSQLVKSGILASKIDFYGQPFPPGIQVRFYDVGSLNFVGSVDRERVVEYLGISYLLKPEEADLSFHDNGWPAQGVLAKEARIEGRDYPKGSEASFDDEGRLRAIRPGADVFLDGIFFAKDRLIQFYGNGRILSGFLAHEQKIDWILFGPYQILFHPSGKVSQGVLASSQTIQGIPYPINDVIDLNEQGFVIQRQP